MIERVSIFLQHTIWMVSPTGGLYTIPNGEIRTVRNFSRGRFSVTSATFAIAAEDLEKSLSSNNHA